MADPVQNITPEEEAAADVAAASGSPGAPPAPTAGEVAFDDASAPEEPIAEPTAAPDAGVDAPEAPEADLDTLVAKARERDEYLALAQRTQADFENYRRRTARDAAQAADRGVAKVAKELIPALDHLGLALQAARTPAAEGQAAEPPEGGELAKGFKLVHDEIVAALERVGLEAFSPEGQVFDPAEHEAMAQLPAEGAQAGTVLQVYQQGYRLNGAVLRPARVVVAA